MSNPALPADSPSASAKIESSFTPPVVVSSHDKLSNFSLGDNNRFDGTNFDEFVVAFRLMLHLSDKLYYVDDSEPPVGANVKRDSITVYGALFMNINGQARGIISSHVNDGLAAWKAFTSHYGKVDVGTTLALASELGHLTWLGGDYDSFSTFISRFDKLVSDLRSRKCNYEDWYIAMMLLGKVPIEFIRHKIELEDPQKLRSADVVSLLSSSINFQEGANTQNALLARQTFAASPFKRDECSHCRDIEKKAAPRYYHPADRCYTKYPHLLEEDRRRKEKAKNRKDKTNDTVVAAKQEGQHESANIVHAETTETCFISLDKRETSSDWIVDSGCTTSVVPDASLLDAYTASNGKYITIGDGTRLPIHGTGSFPFTGTDGKAYCISHVLHVPAITARLLSVRAFTSKGASFAATGSSFTFTSSGSSVPFIVGITKNGLLRTQLARQLFTDASA